MAKHLARYDNAEVLLDHEVVSIGQDEKEAWLDVQTPDGEKQISATYIIGYDGGGSKIRKELLGCDSFPGMTWSNQIVATNVYYPRFRKSFWVKTIG
ncbi:FAD-dependent monooxygenase terC [Fulvia fulva]|uniref:FAD-dependent monooxygenase terC n=1 Tax=Passalora fulva TaxID=5499 RepID=A0A9Q8P8A3_PASFU|nr:FAD-dependent monooxygenase terC [Fulvia fulva]UJO17010.1 FAD-dependent monooxygenase terC [Fulvia fulva]